MVISVVANFCQNSRNSFLDLLVNKANYQLGMRRYITNHWLLSAELTHWRHVAFPRPL